MGEDADSSEQGVWHNSQKRSRQRGTTPPMGRNTGTEHDFELVEVPDTEPVNRKKGPTEPATEEERLQQLIEKACSQCRHGRYPEVKQALEKGFPINSLDKDGNTLLIIACQNNHKKIVKMLMKHGADPTAKNHKGFDAAHYAKLYKHEDLLRHLQPN